ncbi:MAG: hypothetical protein AB7T06_32975 [Kofleriaceae bacterium]
MKRFTIAMAVLTAALFGGAIYETCKPGPSADELACDALKPQIAEFDALQSAKKSQLAGLVGNRGQPGPRFAGIAIGERAEPSAIELAQHTTTPTSDHPYSIWVNDTNGIVTRIEIELGRYNEAPCERDKDDPCSCAFESKDRALCDEFGQQLVRAWGAPNEPGVWIDAATNRRATYSQCTLAFE